MSNLFNSQREGLSQDQINYILSGFSESILRDYSIIYSPKYVEMTLDKNKRNFHTNNLEERVFNKSLNTIEKIRENFYSNIEKIRINSLRTLNKINSNIIDTSRKGLESVKEIAINEKTDGSVVFRFS